MGLQHFDLAKPLPNEVVGSAGNILTRYRQYPVFSKPWFIGRLKIAMLAIAFIVIVNLIALVGKSSHISFATALELILLLSLLYSLYLNLLPAIASWIRQYSFTHDWSFAKERRLILASLLVVLLGLLVAGDYLEDYYFSRVDTPVIAAERARLHAERDSLPIYTRVAVKGAGYSFPLLVLFCIGGGLAYLAYLKQREKLLEYESAQQLHLAAQARHEAEMRVSVLQAQIEPHFLFNTLASLRSLISTEPQKAIEFVDLFTTYLRSTMPKISPDGHSAFATLGTQLNAVQSYLELMRFRMGSDRLQYRIEVDDSLRALNFPPYMVMTLVENAIKHGLEALPEGGALFVHAQRAAENLIVTVSDNGSGFGVSTQTGSGVGLANIRTHLAQLYGDMAKLELLPRMTGDWLCSQSHKHGKHTQGFSALVTIPLADAS